MGNASDFDVKKAKVILCIKCGKEAYRCIETKIAVCRHFSFFHVDENQTISCCRCVVEITELRTDAEAAAIEAQEVEAVKK